MRRAIVLAALLAAAIPGLALAQDANQGATKPITPDTESQTEAVGKSVPTMKAPGGDEAQHPPTGRTGAEVPEMRSGDSAGAGADTAVTPPADTAITPPDHQTFTKEVGKAVPTMKAPADTPPANTAVTPPDHQTFTKEVGEAVPTMKAPDGDKAQHPPTNRVGESVPPMKPGDAAKGSGAGEGATTGQ